MLRILLKKGEDIARALKRYKRKVRDTKLLKEQRERKHYTKPSDAKRKSKQKTIKTREYRDKHEDLK